MRLSDTCQKGLQKSWKNFHFHNFFLHRLKKVSLKLNTSIYLEYFIMHGEMETRTSCHRIGLHKVWLRNKQQNAPKCCNDTRGADTSLVRPTFRCRRTESCRWKEVSVRASNCKSFFFVTETVRKHVRRRARFQHRDASCHQFFSPCKVRRWRIFTPFWQKSWERATSYATVKNWVAQFNLLAPEFGI
jgi:hypothetical protein